MPEGLFISLEGGEGAGKSTQARLLAEALRARGRAVALTREPGGAPSAELIRSLLVSGDTGRWRPMSETLLHMAARVEHVAHVVRPAMERGAVVISDRYVDSTRVYQGLGQKIGLDVVDRLHAIALDGLMPDLTLVLDLPVEAGMARAHHRGGDENRYERMGEAFHQSLRQGFLDLASRETGRFRVIDATQDKERVARAVLEAVLPLLVV